MRNLAVVRYGGIPPVWRSWGPLSRSTLCKPPYPFRPCRFRDGQTSGVFASDRSEALFDDCDIAANALSGLEIKSGANPLIRRTKVRDNKQGGVFTYEKALGTLEECDVIGNAFAGVEIRDGAAPVVRRCRINRNGYEGVWVHKGGAGRIEGSNLSGNGRGAWDVETSTTVERIGNTE